MFSLRSLSGFALGVAMSLPGSAMAAELVINADIADPAPLKGWQTLVEGFKAENPDIDVKLNIYDRESYKKSVRNWLTSVSPDVVFWYVGNRMKQFADPGLLEDVSSIYTDTAKAELGPVATALVTDKGKQYGVPYSYYQWGIYYRKDLFQSAGIAAAPKTWDELLSACDKLKAAGLEPISIGSKDLWPTAGWFDYIDLRLNGYDFHMQLMGGKVSYADPKVSAVFGKWQELLDKGCFAKNHAALSWQESQSLLYQGKSAMMLMGNFITPNFPAEIAASMEYMPFPTIDPAIPVAEEAPMDSIHVPAKAKNKEDGKKFLAYVLRADVQESLNKTLLQVPVNQKSAVADDRFLQTGKTVLGGAEHIAQFFDRDTSEDLATIGMKGFQEFMIDPSRLDRVIANLERARKRIYKVE